MNNPCLPAHVGGLPSPGVRPVGDGVGLREARLAALLIEVGVRRVADAELITCKPPLMSASQSQPKCAEYICLPCKRPSPSCQPSAEQPEIQPIIHTGWNAAICLLQAYYTTSQGPYTGTSKVFNTCLFCSLEGLAPGPSLGPHTVLRQSMG